MNKNIEAFMIYVSFLSLRFKIIIYPAQKAQILLLLAKKVIFPTDYLDIANLLLKKLAKVLPKQIGINKHVIKLE